MLENGMVLRTTDGEYGMVTNTRLGMLIGFSNGNVIKIGDEFKDVEFNFLPKIIDRVYCITRKEQILGMYLNESNLELIWERLDDKDKLNDFEKEFVDIM